MSIFQALLWFCVAAYGLHILEEFSFDWKHWARAVIQLPVEWNDFYITNCLVIVLGIVASQVAPLWPSIALSFPALMLINATFFHVMPFLRTGGRFSPGLITALLLFYPVGIATFAHTHLSWRIFATAFSLGAILHAAPVGFILLRSRAYFDQTRGLSSES